MNYSRRQLYALGEPLGESATRLKPGGRVYGGGGSPSTPADTTSTTTAELPEWARGYAKDTLAKASTLTDIGTNPYQQYGGERIAGFQPMQQQAFQGAANMQPSAQVGLGSGIAGMAGVDALGTNYQGGQFQGGQFDTQAAQQYMNPYTQNVVDYQKSQALRDFQIAQPMRQATAVQQGAFGGSRSAIVDAEAQRTLNSQLQGIEATGQQAAFQNAQQQFNQDMARRLQAQQMGEQSRQYGAGLGMQGLQTGLQAASTLGQLGQTQYGQQMGINQLQSQYGQQQQQQAQRPLDMAYQDFMNQQNYPYKQLGFMSDMIRGLPLGQQSTSQMYQAPPSTLQTVGALGLGAYGVNQLSKADGGLAGAYAGGGMVAFGNGGDTDVTDSPMNDPTEMAKAVADLSDEQLQQIIQHPSSAAELQAAKTELATRASESRGLASAYNMMPEQAPSTQAVPQAPMMQAAKGGIMGFNGEDGSSITEDILQKALDAQNEEGGSGNAEDNAFYKNEGRRIYSELANEKASAPMTADERRAAAKAYYQEVQDMAGPSPYAAQEGRIAGLEKQQAENLGQQKGLAALAAIPAVLQGGNALRGLGAGAGAFGGMYGKALQADRAEKLSLMSAKNNLEEAQYKTRVGMVGEARQLTTEARRDAQAAEAARIAKLKALGTVATAQERASRPPKAATRNFDIERVEAVAKNLRNTVPPNKGETPEQYDARIESMATFQYVKAKNAKEIASQSDITSRSNVTSNVTSNQLQDKGPGVLTTSAEDVESKEINNGVKHFETIASEPYKSPENKKLIKKYMDANGGDLAKAALAYAKDTRVTSKAATSGGAAPAPAKPAPKASSTAPGGGQKIMSMDDVQATAKASGKTVDEVKAAAQAKGYTIR
jgi:hypothetical protein